MIHHDQRNYDEAKSEAAQKMRDKLGSIFEAGRDNTLAALSKVHSEQPKDHLVASQVLDFRASPTGVEVTFDDNIMSLHPHAKQQVCQKLGIPKAYVDRLQGGGEWANDLLVHNLQQLNAHGKDRHLLRSVDGQVRGWLSDKFRRLDSAPILESFIEAICKVGGVAWRGRYLDTKVGFSFLLPVMFEPVKDEVVAFGLELRNSDFGDGRLTVNEFLLRMWCTNLAIGVDYFKKTHVGGRLNDDVQYRDTTYDLDTKATAAAIHDTVLHALSPASVHSRVNIIRKAAEEQKVEDLVLVMEGMRKNNRLTKGESESVLEAFRSPDVQLLPPGNSLWRLSNAISLVAGRQEDPYRAIELENAAGEVAGLV